MREADDPSSVIVVNLRGAGICGDTEEEAITNFHEAITGISETYANDRIEIPRVDPEHESIPGWHSDEVDIGECLRFLDHLGGRAVVVGEKGSEVRRRGRRERRNEMPEEVQAEKRFKSDYIKSNFFRVVHADGMYGGVTPSGNIHIDFWNDRQPIPQTVTNEVVVRGDGPPTIEEVQAERIGRQNVIREVEIGVVMDVGTAKSLIQWLGGKVAELEAAIEKAKDVAASRAKGV